MFQSIVNSLKIYDYRRLFALAGVTAAIAVVVYGALFYGVG